MREMPGCLPGTLDMLVLEALEHRGHIEAEWGESDNRRRARCCRLTHSGRRRLKNDVASWNRLADAIAAALAPTPREV
jgi:DNA-binding PadR family transcriptional regulator